MKIYLDIYIIYKYISSYTYIQIIMQANTLTFDMISELIKYTQSENPIDNDDEILKIINLIKLTDINKDNIHCILKLIANLTKSKLITNPNIFTFNVDELIKLCLINKISDSDSDSDLNRVSINDGDIVSFVNICCSPIFDNVDKALELIDKYNVHKTSSYIPIFKYLIVKKDYNKLKQLYTQYEKINKIIIEHNREIKEFNHKARLYNEKIKLLKRKFTELNQINIEIENINFKNNTSICINSIISQIDDSLFKEIVPKNERNIIEITNYIFKELIVFANDESDYSFINNLIKNISEPSDDIISALKNYFTKRNFEYIYTNFSDGKCLCCENIVQNNVISDDDRQQILSRISNKITTTIYRNDNGQLINKYERKIIIDEWSEFIKILNTNKFDIIIDGANLGYINTKGSCDINIKYIYSIIQNIVSKTDNKILLIIHQRHLSKIKQFNFHQKYASNVKIYTTPNNVNDDWFWLYASLYSKCFILTNDQSRDHGCMVSYQNEIKKWIQYYQIRIMPDTTLLNNFYQSKKSVIIPGIYVSDKLIHIINDHNMKSICVHMN